MKNQTEIPKKPVSPASILSELLKKDKIATEKIKKLYQKMNSAVEEYQSENTVLFSRDSLNIKARDWNYSKTFTINSFSIIASPWHNYCFENDTSCHTRVFISLEIENSEEKETWYCDLFSIRIRVHEGLKKHFGIISRGATGINDSGFYNAAVYCDYDEIMVEEFADFEKLEDIIYQGINEIGYSVIKRKKIIE